MDVSLWREFGRLGVCERGELINKMRALLGAALTQDTATFFLDMTDWDLQAAVCCYLDTYAAPSQSMEAPPPIIAAPPPVIGPSVCGPLVLLPNSLPSSLPSHATHFNLASHATHFTMPHPLNMRLENAQDPVMRVQPNQDLKWSWSVMNNGENSWPHGCVLRSESVPETFVVNAKPIPALNSGDVSLLEASFVTPTKLGIHCQQYHLCTPDGLPFGDTLKISILVVNDDQQNSPECPSYMIIDENMC